MLQHFRRRGNWVSNVRIKRILRRVVPLALQRRLGTHQDWSIGLFAGEDPLAIAPLEGVRNPVLTHHDVDDMRASFVADPFAVCAGGVWYLYFEAMDRRAGLGRIALATSTDLRTWRYEGVVLSEPFHLSYPQVMAFDGAYWLVPESWESGTVRCYRAERPQGPWTLAHVLLRGPVLLDPSLVRHDGRWWLFVETNPRHAYDTLRLWSADSLKGPWKEHPASPLVAGDAGRARPAGRIVRRGGRLVRWGQDCRDRYGASARAFEILELTPQVYREREVPLSVAADPQWPRSPHHLDPHPLEDGRWLVFVDGAPS